MQVGRLVGWGLVVRDETSLPHRHRLHPRFVRLLTDAANLKELDPATDREYVAALTAFAPWLATNTALYSGRNALEIKAAVDRLRGVAAGPLYRLPYRAGTDESTYTWLDLLDEIVEPRTMAQLTQVQLTRVHSVEYDALVMALNVLESLGLADEGQLQPHAVTLLSDAGLFRVLRAVPLRLDQPIDPIVAAFRQLVDTPDRPFSVGDLLAAFRTGPPTVAELLPLIPMDEFTLRDWLHRLESWGVLERPAGRGRIRYMLSERAVAWLRDARGVEEIDDRDYAAALITFTNLLRTLSPPGDRYGIRALADVIDLLERTSPSIGIGNRPARHAAPAAETARQRGNRATAEHGDGPVQRAGAQLARPLAAPGAGGRTGLRRRALPPESARGRPASGDRQPGRREPGRRRRH
jgi:hypothetical protein